MSINPMTRGPKRKLNFEDNSSTKKPNTSPTPTEFKQAVRDKHNIEIVNYLNQVITNSSNQTGPLVEKGCNLITKLHQANSPRSAKNIYKYTILFFGDARNSSGNVSAKISQVEELLGLKTIQAATSKPIDQL
jgi:hypothetical protein